MIWNGAAPIGRPIGFQTISIRVERTTRGAVKRVYFEPQLCYVVKLRRQQGVGSVLAAAIGSWLRECRVYAPFAARGGVAVEYYCEYESPGGEALSRIIEENFEYMNECRRDIPAEEIGWDIRDLEITGGY